ncbi:MAG: hypothetical protein AB2L14_14905 [Candidatus Xenobiia bacterium LiM19]
MPSLSFSAKGTVDSIKTRLDELMYYDRIIEKKLKKARTFLWIAGIITFLSFFAMMTGVAAPFFLALLFLLIPALIYNSRMTSLDLENRRIELGRALFHIVGQDINPEAECSVEIDLQGYQKHGQMLDNEKSGLFGSSSRSRYADKWFSTRGKLCDGNVFKISIEQSVKRAEKRKRKYTKVTEAITESVKFILKVDRDSYPNISKISTLLSPSVTVAGVEIKKIQASDSIVRLQAETSTYRCTRGRYGKTEQGIENLITGKTLISLFVHFYRNLEKCR